MMEGIEVSRGENKSKEKEGAPAGTRTILNTDRRVSHTIQILRLDIQNPKHHA